MQAESTPALIFLGGCPRSGLTLSRAIIDAHPDVLCGSDALFTPGFALQYRSFSAVLGGLHEQTFGLAPRDVAAIFARCMTRIITPRAAALGKRVVAEKTALNVLAFRELAEILPQARFVHVVRDGRDVAASLLARDWRNPATGERLAHTSDPNAAAQYWGGLAARGLAAEEALAQSGRILRLRYEDLVLRPKRTLKGLFAFLGVGWSDAVWAFHERALPLEGLERESADRLARPLDAASVGRWRAAPEARVAVETHAADALRALGY